MNVLEQLPVAREWLRRMRPPRMSSRRAIIVAVIASMLLHLAGFTVLVLISTDPSRFNFAKNRVKPREIELQVLPPDEPPLFTLMPAPEAHFLDSRGLDLARDAPEHPLFESDENMRAASELPATGDIPLPSQEGVDRPFNAFQTQRSLLGPTARPFTPVAPMPPMASKPAANAPPEDVALQPTTTPEEATPESFPTTSNPPQPAPPPKTAEDHPTKKPADNDIVLWKKFPKSTAVTAIQPPPPDTPPPVAHAAVLRPLDEPLAKLTTPPPKPQPSPTKVAKQTQKMPPRPQQPTQQEQAQQMPPQPQRTTGYQPEQEQNHIEGSISNRGKKAVDALGTPMGRYRKQVSDAIGSRWYYYIHDKMDLLAFGSVRISFAIDTQGHVSRVKVDSNSSNQSLADVSMNAIRDAEIGPPPAEAGPVSQESLEWSLTFTYYPFAK